MTVIAVIGSSNAAGVGASTYIRDPDQLTGWCSPGSSWVGLLAERYESSVRILNFSQSGMGSTWARQRILETPEISHSQAAVVCTNPILDYENLHTYYDNLSAIIELCRKMNIYVVLRGAYSNNSYSRKQYEDMLRLNESINSMGYSVIDHMACLSDDCGHYIGGKAYHIDGLHPSDAGHKVLFQACIDQKIIENILQNA
ncbi:lysophospholipase L1-like esterase [Methylobacterium sp. PvP062]|uniref:Lysophospholipase L1-like esterase n=1 Tax=Methylobacterium radiotolerans TaxID=31998 RepID=A0ABV2N9E6_9HYPH|nr:MULTISPECIES: SGNH/GDSL hydrolase family protein [unclassified Methylobacterium]MBP2493651.1 lysophospholipase L1-like esterase [Methylobacterium sp. PvP105]MBP2499976.1 lysophospholipase L1-like esterase [Methylobacterium sp. PvP109]MCX7336218.1 SGNH/GDSL hydrolase family protein [Hyphomicrobiales bacterium]